MKRVLFHHIRQSATISRDHHAATYCGTASRSTSSRNVRLSSAAVRRSTFLPRTSPSSNSRPAIRRSPGTQPGSNSTRTSTSLVGPKSSRKIDPNSDSRRIRLRRQNAAIEVSGKSTPCRVIAIGNLRATHKAWRYKPTILYPASTKIVSPVTPVERSLAR